MDPRTDEGRRIMALGHLHMVEAATRTATAKTMLHILDNHRRDITLEEITDAMHAEVVSRLATFLDEPTLHRIARDTWGDRTVDVNSTGGHVVWVPADDTLFITTRDLVCRVIAPMVVKA